MARKTGKTVFVSDVTGNELSIDEKASVTIKRKDGESVVFDVENDWFNQNGINIAVDPKATEKDYKGQGFVLVLPAEKK